MGLEYNACTKNNIDKIIIICRKEESIIRWLKYKRLKLGLCKNIYKGLSYEARDYYLYYLNFASYEEYLNSQLWQEIRAKAFRIRKNKCCICGKIATNIHHSRYRIHDLIGRVIQYLHPLCRDCHILIEFEKDGTKSTFSSALRKFIHSKPKRSYFYGSGYNNKEFDHLIFKDIINDN